MKLNVIKPVGPTPDTVYSGVCDVPDDLARQYLEAGYAVEATGDGNKAVLRKRVNDDKRPRNTDSDTKSD